MQSSSSTKGSAGTSTKKRGFANMDPARHLEIASRGGKAAHKKGLAHEFTSEEASAAGKKSAIARSRSSPSGTK